MAAMILTYRVVFGIPFRLELAEKWGPRVELEAIEFLNGVPIDWRIGDDPIRSGLRTHCDPMLRGFHDLQRPIRTGGTRGLPAASLELETRGIGDATLLVWLREGTFPVTGACAA
jgi:hypothetical protein